MDLVVVNNQIVLMRKAVRLAKVHIVRKLTRNIGKLNKKKGSEDQLNRNKRRAQNQLEEINAIKALDCDDVSRFALINTKKFAQVVTKGKPNDKTRVMTRLAEHSFIGQLVNDFRQKFPNWENQLPYLLKMRLVRSKFKATTANERKNSKKERKKKPKRKNDDLDATISSQDQDDDDDEKVIEKFNLAAEDDEDEQRVRSEKVIERFNLTEEDDEDDQHVRSEKVIERFDLANDDFSDHESERLYLDGDAKAVAKDEFIAFINDGKDDDDDHAETMRPVKPRQAVKRRPQKRPEPKRPIDQKRRERSNIAPTNEGSLHPSWDAKKRLNQHNARFQGTKIKFDD